MLTTGVERNVLERAQPSMISSHRLSAVCVRVLPDMLLNVGGLNDLITP